MSPTAPASTPHSRPYAGLFFCLVGIAALFGTRWDITRGLPVLSASVAGYCGLVVLICSLADRLDTRPSGAYPDFGRYFFALAAIMTALTGALVATRTFHPQDLVIAEKLIPVAAITATLLAVSYFVATRTRGRSPRAIEGPNNSLFPKRKNEVRSGQMIKATLAILLVIASAILIHQRMTEYQTLQDQQEQRRIPPHPSVPPWHQGFNDFTYDMTVGDLSDRLSRAGYRAVCKNKLTPADKIAADNQATCTAKIHTAHGIPARVVAFWFDDRGLTSHLIRYDRRSWEALTRYLDSQGRRLDQYFGRAGAFGPRVIGWRFDSGVVMAAEADTGEDITVLWTAKEPYSRKECADRQVASAKRKPRPQMPVETWWPGTSCGTLVP